MQRVKREVTAVYVPVLADESGSVAMLRTPFDRPGEAQEHKRELEAKGVQGVRIVRELVH